MGQRRVTERICGAPFSYSPLILQASIGSSTLRSPWGFCEISTIACKCDLHVGGVGFSPTHLCYPQAPINHGEQMLPTWQGASLWSVRLKPMPCCLYRRFLAENWPLLVQACRISQAWCSCQTTACLSHSWCICSKSCSSRDTHSPCPGRLGRSPWRRLHNLFAGCNNV